MGLGIVLFKGHGWQTSSKNLCCQPEIVKDETTNQLRGNRERFVNNDTAQWTGIKGGSVKDKEKKRNKMDGAGERGRGRKCFSSEKGSRSVAANKKP